MIGNIKFCVTKSFYHTEFKKAMKFEYYFSVERRRCKKTENRPLSFCPLSFSRNAQMEIAFWSVIIKVQSKNSPKYDRIGNRKVRMT